MRTFSLRVGQRLVLRDMLSEDGNAEFVVKIVGKYPNKSLTFYTLQFANGVHCDYTENAVISVLKRLAPEEGCWQQEGF